MFSIAQLSSNIQHASLQQCYHRTCSVLLQNCWRHIPLHYQEWLFDWHQCTQLGRLFSATQLENSYTFISPSKPIESYNLPPFVPFRSNYCLFILRNPLHPAAKRILFYNIPDTAQIHKKIAFSLYCNLCETLYAITAQNMNCANCFDGQSQQLCLALSWSSHIHSLMIIYPCMGKSCPGLVYNDQNTCSALEKHAHALRNKIRAKVLFTLISRYMARNRAARFKINQVNHVHGCCI